LFKITLGGIFLSCTFVEVLDAGTMDTLVGNKNITPYKIP
jgi:hypothetical protein